jgi:hypothetical protein
VVYICPRYTCDCARQSAAHTHLMSQSNNALALARTNNQLREVRADLKAKEDEIEALVEHVQTHTRDRVGPAVSTGLTFLGAATAGFIDGFLGEKNLVGPIPINSVLAAGAAIFSITIDDPNAAEATAAIARGMGSPTVYELTKNAAAKHFRPAEWASNKPSATPASATLAAATPTNPKKA